MAASTPKPIRFGTLSPCLLSCQGECASLRSARPIRSPGWSGRLPTTRGLVESLEEIALNGEAEGRSHQAAAFRGEATRAKRSVVNLTFASWNQIVLWLRTLDTLRPDA